LIEFLAKRRTQRILYTYAERRIVTLLAAIRVAGGDRTEAIRPAPEIEGVRSVISPHFSMFIGALDFEFVARPRLA
jgi:hypothetical protein